MKNTEINKAFGVLTAKILCAKDPDPQEQPPLISTMVDGVLDAYATWLAHVHKLTGQHAMEVATHAAEVILEVRQHQETNKAKSLQKVLDEEKNATISH